MKKILKNSLSGFKLSAIFFIVFLGLTGRSFAYNVYYVATNGSDSNPGTYSSPFLTLQKGVDAASAGDTIIVKDGTYGPDGAGHVTAPVNINKAGTSGAWITLRAEHKWAAILDCELTALAYINFQANSAYWTIEGFDIRNGYNGGIWANSGGAQNIIIRGNHIHNIGNREDNTEIGIVGIYTDAGAQNFLVDGNVINDVGRTNTYTNSFDHGIYSHGNLNIINNVFYNSRSGWHIQTAVHFSGTIANNTFYGPNMYSGSTKDGQIMLWDAADGSVVIRNNIFYNSNGTAITSYNYSQGSGSCSCDNNIVYGSGVTVGAPSPCSVSNNHLNTDPLFENTSNYDFHLQSGSPAIDDGVTVSMVSNDFDGVSRPQCDAYDIGAFEYSCSEDLSVELTSPTDMSSYTSLATISISATASDPGGSISKVEFYAGTTLINTDYSYPYSYSWTNVPAASYDIIAVAYGSGGAKDTSSAVSVTVNCGSPDDFVNTSITNQTGIFTSEFDVIPGRDDLNAVAGLSNGSATDWTDMACILRFNSSGNIDAIDGANYNAASTIPYSGGISYHVRFVVNIATKKYEIYVTPAGGNEVIVGSQYDFRFEQSSVSQLNNLCKWSEFCNLNISNLQSTALNCGSPQNFVNTGFTNQTGSFTVNYDLVATSDSLNGLVGLSDGSATDWADLACIVRFNEFGNIDVRDGNDYTAAVTMPYFAGVIYHVKMYIYTATKKYDVFVTPEGGSTVTLASGYDFRTEQSSISQLNNRSVWTQYCNLNVSNFSAQSGITGDGRTLVLEQGSIDHPEEHEFLIFPNPVKNIFVLDAGNIGSSVVLVALYSIDGKLVWTKSFEHPSGIFRKSFTTGNLKAGVYLVKFESNAHQKIAKLIVE